MQKATQVVDAAHRLLASNGANFTTAELVREAHISFRSFYQHFASKDDVVLAVIEDVLRQAADELAIAARGLDGPLERLHFYVTDTVCAVASSTAVDQSRFITAEYWRLHPTHADQLEAARQPFIDLLLAEVRAATDLRLLHPRDLENDVELVVYLVSVMYQHYAYASSNEPIEARAERIWEFCLTALGGAVEPGRRQRGARPRSPRTEKGTQRGRSRSASQSGATKR